MHKTNNKLFWLSLMACGLIGLAGAAPAGAYLWPLAPMDVQHNVSATFGECRADRDHFHDGVDLPLGYGGAVLSVNDAQVLTIEGNIGANSYIRVGRYCYVHVDPNPDLNVGDFVYQGDVVGTTNNQNHIHFKDGGGASGTAIINALRPDGLAPFVDTYKPTVQTIKFYENATTQIFPTSKISGLVDIVSRSFDKTDNSSYGGNNGVYTIGYEVFADDETTTVLGPYFPYRFDTIPSNAYIENVYFVGSGTSTYYYIVSNQISHDSFWDTRWVDPGHYLVSVYCSDTRDNWDTTSVWVEVTEQDVTPCTIPRLASAVGTRENSLTVSWLQCPDEDLLGYRLYHSYDCQTWFSNNDEDDLPDSVTSLHADYFQNDWALYFKITSVDSAAVPNESSESDIYGTRLTDTGPKVLVVDGFDRTSGTWTEPSHPFTHCHAHALDALETAFDCCSNETVIAGDILLDDYDAVVWILGDESTEDSTFTPSEQALVTAYLEAGGNLFLSGSEVGYDLVDQGSTGDAEFYGQTLHADFIAGDAETSAVAGIEGTIFVGFNFIFSDSSEGLYGEEGPDAIAPMGGSLTNLLYQGTSYGAGLEYAGTFGSGTDEGRLIYLGFPFENIYPESDRIEVMNRILSFFEVTTPVESQEDQAVLLPETFALHHNYPNPFNPATTISFSIPEGGSQQTTLRIYNVTGQQVRTLMNAALEPGHHAIAWDGRDDESRLVGSGVYFYVLRSGSFSGRRKMVLLK